MDIKIINAETEIRKSTLIPAVLRAAWIGRMIDGFPRDMVGAYLRRTEPPTDFFALMGCVSLRSALIFPHIFLRTVLGSADDFRGPHFRHCLRSHVVRQLFVD